MLEWAYTLERERTSYTAGLNDASDNQYHDILTSLYEPRHEIYIKMAYKRITLEFAPIKYCILTQTKTLHILYVNNKLFCDFFKGSLLRIK